VTPSEAPEPSDHPDPETVASVPIGSPTSAPSSSRTTGKTETGVDSLPDNDPDLSEADQAKASKADNARVPEYLWDDRVMEAALACGVDRDKLLAALQVIRRGAS
jgi:hypothetical protein